MLLCQDLDAESKDVLLQFFKLSLHFFECLYDPYFFWRKKLKCWQIDNTRLKITPALLHNEVVPFFHDCFQKDKLPTDIQLRLLHVFGAIMSGSQDNALKAITPATLDIMLKVLSAKQRNGPTNEQRQETTCLKELVLKSVVRMVHVIHGCSPDQRQVEVAEVMEGYMQVLLEMEQNPDTEPGNNIQLNIINTINEMLMCQDRSSLQVLLVSGGTFDAFVSLLQQALLTGFEAQKLAMSVIHVMQAILSGSSKAKSLFKDKVGYEKFVEVLKSLGQPSMELLKSLLSLVVEDAFVEKEEHVVHNTQAALMLLQWLPDIQSHDLQIWLSQSLRSLCGAGYRNRMKCCSEGMISTILVVLERAKQINSTAIGHLIDLLEVLGTHSVTRRELKQLIGHLRLDEDGQHRPYSTRIMRAIAMMARREGRDGGALYFYDIQSPTDGIALPGYRKWPGQAYAIHVWLCLDVEFELDESIANTGQFRRQLYHFPSNLGHGFEAFFTPDCELVVAVYSKKEYCTATVEDASLKDGKWHCVDICHTNSRRPFSQSQLTVYIDGTKKLTAHLKFPNMTEPFSNCRIGSPGVKTAMDILMSSSSSSSHDRRSRWMLGSLFRVASKKSDANEPYLGNITGGKQDEFWGPPIAIHGQIGTICIFCDVLHVNQVKALHAQGPNEMNMFYDNPELCDLVNKLLIHYNAKACKGNVCFDLSPHQNHGQLKGVTCEMWDIKDVIHTIGGIEVLFPLLEQCDTVPPPPQSTDITPEDSPTVETRGDWVVVPGSSYTDWRLVQNQVAAFLTLLRNFLQTKDANQASFIRTEGAATVAALLQKVKPELIDVNVLMSVQLLVESCSVDNVILEQHFYRYILFDFRVWSKSDFPVRIGHIQYLSTIIKEHKKQFRKKYGTQYFLDVIRMYYSVSTDGGLSDEDRRTIRVSLVNLIKFYIVKDITIDELASIISFLTVVKQENIICEILDLLLSLLERHNKYDQLYLLLLEPHMSELLYVLLTYSNYTVGFYEKIIKVLHRLLKTDRVYEKSKNRLRLLDVGHYGLVCLMQGYQLSVGVVKQLINQVSYTETAQTYSAVLAILTLFHNGGFDVKLEASRQLLQILVSKLGAAKAFAKQLCWHETIVRLLVQGPLTVNAESMNSGVEVTDNCLTLNGQTLNPLVEVRENTGEKEMCISCEPPTAPSGGATRPTDLDIANNANNNNCSMTSSLGTGLSSNTPLFIQAQRDDLLPSSDEDRSRSMSRSTSTSTEDVSSPQSGHRRSSPIPANTSDRSDSPTLRARRLSAAQTETLKQALENIGVRASVSGLTEHTELSEELCENLLVALVTIAWKGTEGSDRQAWKVRGQVFACLDFISESHILIRPKNELKRRLFEMMLHSCTSDIKDAGQPIAHLTENAVELVRLLRNFVTDDSHECDNKYSERLLDEVMSLLDVLGVWLTDGNGWKEMVHLGFSILLTFAKLPNLDMCAVATAKLHALVQTQLISSSAEASYIIGCLDSIILKAVEENTDNYAFVIPVLKALVDKGYVLLNMEVSLPNLPHTSMSPTFFDDFRQYCCSDEWRNFVTNYIYPQRHHFMDSSFSESHSQTNSFWRQCSEELMLSVHKRNREIGDSKLKFEHQIVDVFKSTVAKEQRRFQNVSTQQRNQYLSIRRRWRATKRFFKSDRGVWNTGNTCETSHWKLSNQENFSRMKVKMVQNYNFDPHIEASRDRDNVGIDVLKDGEPENIIVVKEALVSQEDIADDTLGDEDWNVISTSSAVNDEYSGKEKLVISEDCDLITLVSVVQGRLEVTTTHVYFFDLSPVKEEGGEDFKWMLSQLREIHFRRYNLHRSALEMFLVDQTNYFLNFSSKSVRNKIYSRILSLRPPNVSYHGTRSPADLLRASGLTQKWVQREISNFDYLMQLNTIAGRTYNDLSQYPVFPWILCDYSSKILDLESPFIYRNLSKPMGVVNPRNEKEVQQKFETFEDPSGMIEKFHYGTHYSNAASVMHYMVRLEPFTTLHIQLQSGKFDVADRQFHSIPGSWQSLYDNPNDVKELIPEFFYLPEFLVNSDKLDLGRLQLTQEPVSDVILPPWAETPEEFIYKHRQALESEYVSNNLHNWIDLIFGYKQKGPAAVEALNVFYYCTYEGAVDLDAIENEQERKALEGMINNFGQTPTQLLKDPHPRRLAFEDAVAKAIKNGKPLSIFYFLFQLKPFFVEVSSEQDPLVFVHVPRSQFKSIVQYGTPDSMITVTENGIVGVHGWLPFDKSISNYYTFEKDPSMLNSKTRKRVGGPFAPDLKVEPKLFMVSQDAKLLFSVGYWDNSFQVYHLGKGKRINHIVRHIDIVTCLSLDYCGNQLITGSRDTTCIIWQIQQQGGYSHNVNNEPLQVLYGHNAEVTAVHISVELDMAVSCSQDGLVIQHTVRKGHYVRTLRPPCDPHCSLTIPMLCVSEMGQIIVYTQQHNSENEEKHSVHLYSVNGRHLFMDALRFPLKHMAISGDHLVLGDNQGHLMFKELFGLKHINTLSLLVPVTCISILHGASHILIGLKDGKLIIVGVKGKPVVR
ncbi:neurobeachin-like protein 1 [Gigantopelta aegis]|uniref:neurobeachin-like protein 1 n=1 Tax=Gigantopelta aegis TaxID=1735272 RepID=UPI001B88B0C7|nr:neurobeachin-like protein 1 [Gigantopelta aegis]